MKKNKYIDIILNNIEKEDDKPNEASVSEKLIKRIIRRILTFLTIKFFLLFILLCILLLPLIIFIAIFFSLAWSDNLSDNSWNYSIDWSTFISNFSEDNLDTPLWIPVERAIINYWFDYTKYKSALISGFLKLFYMRGHEYYSWHRWIDFARIYSDKAKWYNPYILSTLRGIIKTVESREEINWKLSYEKKIYSWWNTFKYNSTIKKNQEKRIKPYWNHVIISSMDWSLYVIFAHLSILDKSILNADKIWRGNILWRMWTTGNSTGIHLHYEIRYCWSNKNLTKSWIQCSPVNPLWTIIGSENTFLGFSTLPKVNNFVAWVFETIKNKKIEEKEIYEQINIEYKEFCDTNSILFIWKSISCKEAFPIFYSHKNNKLFPKLNDQIKTEEIWEKYIKEEYNIKGVPTSKEIKDIKKIEGIAKKIYTSKELYQIVGKKFSNWKFLNSKKYYLKKIDNNIEGLMYTDSLETLDSLWKKYKKIEDIYNNYYYNSFYKKNKNPYVYNMINSNSIFMDIMDSQWNFISKYSNYWALAIFNQLK